MKTRLNKKSTTWVEIEQPYYNTDHRRHGYLTDELIEAEGFWMAQAVLI